MFRSVWWNDSHVCLHGTAVVKVIEWCVQLKELNGKLFFGLKGHYNDGIVWSLEKKLEHNIIGIIRIEMIWFLMRFLVLLL